MSHQPRKVNQLRAGFVDDSMLAVGPTGWSLTHGQTNSMQSPAIILQLINLKRK
jgi:hypothetical protein